MGADAGMWVVAPDTLVSWKAGRIEITATTSGTRFRTDNAYVLTLLHSFAHPRHVGEVLRDREDYPIDQLAACIGELINAGLLIRSSQPELVASESWDPITSGFHRKSRQSRLRVGPDLDSRPVIPPCLTEKKIFPLELPFRPDARDLAEILDSRRTRRDWGTQPIDGRVFSTLLWMSARDRNQSTRPYPSGGAVYSLELYPVLGASAIECISSGLYRYRPHSHELEAFSQGTEAHWPIIEAAGRSAGANTPPIVFVITSRIARQREVYGELAYSLVLKEVGGLYQTLYLVAEQLGLSACALGGGTPDTVFEQITNTTEFDEPIVGEFIIGRRDPPAP
jgi:SagB-type dehydrogenase family enzyme